MNNLGDSGIPLLTEILEPPAEPVSLASEHAHVVSPLPEIDFDIPEFLTIPAVSAVAALSAEPLPVAAPQWSSHDWQRMEAELSERLSRQVLGRIDFVLEQRVRDSLADVLQVAVEGLAQEIKRGLHQTIEDVIARAVAQEITRAQNTKL